MGGHEHKELARGWGDILPKRLTRAPQKSGDQAASFCTHACMHARLQSFRQSVSQSVSRLVRQPVSKPVRLCIDTMAPKRRGNYLHTLHVSSTATHKYEMHNTRQAATARCVQGAGLCPLQRWPACKAHHSQALPGSSRKPGRPPGTSSSSPVCVAGTGSSNVCTYYRAGPCWGSGQALPAWLTHGC